MDQTTEQLLAGDRRSLARVLTWVENNTPDGLEVLRRIYPLSGRAHIVGITGAGGSGKSTLVNALTRELRSRGQSVGVVAVDPSSPFTRGAILGDRIRMQEHTTDPRVFIRSMASRGALGGLSATTADAVTVMDVAGKDIVVVETLGAGQDEVEIVRTAQTTVVILTPNSGDEVQTMKAGIIEIADILVVNKADLPGADQVASHLRALLSLLPHEAYAPPILRTTAASGEGIVALADALAAHKTHLTDSGELALRRRDAAGHHVRELVRDELLSRAIGGGAAGSEFEEAVQAVAERKLHPREAAARLAARALS